MTPRHLFPLPLEGLSNGSASLCLNGNQLGNAVDEAHGFEFLKPLENPSKIPPGAYGYDHIVRGLKMHLLTDLKGYGLGPLHPEWGIRIDEVDSVSFAGPKALIVEPAVIPLGPDYVRTIGPDRLQLLGGNAGGNHDECRKASPCSIGRNRCGHIARGDGADAFVPEGDGILDPTKSPPILEGPRGVLGLILEVEGLHTPLPPHY